MESIDFYLNREAELLRTIQSPLWMTWQVGPTVIYGRHQIVEQEVNLTYCQAQNITLYQRQSGGGAVYADEGNIMISYISPSPHSQEVFAFFIQRVAAALRILGYEVVTTDHNDILVNGCKVSGAACYTTEHGTIAHCTMLYDTDLDKMQNALTPSADKLEKHAVSSVRQRVANLRAIIDQGDVVAFKTRLDEYVIKCETLV